MWLWLKTTDPHNSMRNEPNQAPTNAKTDQDTDRS